MSVASFGQGVAITQRTTGGDAPLTVSLADDTPIFGVNATGGVAVFPPTGQGVQIAFDGDPVNPLLGQTVLISSTAGGVAATYLRPPGSGLPVIIDGSFGQFTGGGTATPVRITQGTNDRVEVNANGAITLTAADNQSISLEIATVVTPVFEASETGGSTTVTITGTSSSITGGSTTVTGSSSLTLSNASTNVLQSTGSGLTLRTPGDTPLVLQQNNNPRLTLAADGSITLAPESTTTVASGSTFSAADVTLNPSASLNITTADVNITPGAFDVTSSGAINLTTTAGAVVLSTTSGTATLSSSGAVSISSSASTATVTSASNATLSSSGGNAIVTGASSTTITGGSSATLTTTGGTTTVSAGGSTAVIAIDASLTDESGTINIDAGTSGTIAFTAGTVTGLPGTLISGTTPTRFINTSATDLTDGLGFDTRAGSATVQLSLSNGTDGSAAYTSFATILVARGAANVDGVTNTLISGVGTSGIGSPANAAFVVSWPANLGINVSFAGAITNGEGRINYTIVPTPWAT